MEEPQSCQRRRSWSKRHIEAGDGNDFGENDSGMLRRQRQTEGDGCGDEISGLPTLECKPREEHRDGAEQGDREIGHDHWHVRGHGRVDGEKCERSESNRRAKDSPRDECEDEQEQAVEAVHRETRMTLDTVRIILQEHAVHREIALASLVIEDLQRAEMQDVVRHEGGNPKLDERGCSGLMR